MSVVVAYTVIYACCFLFGACMFSFLNVLVYRLQRGIRYWKGRSICPSCNHTLRAFDLIPVVGWFLLRGKCRYCGAKISFRYVSVESLGGCLSCLCYWKYGFTVSAAFTFAFLFLLTLVSGVDWDTMEIPNGFVLGVAAIGITGWAAGMEPDLGSRLIGTVCVSVPMLLLTIMIEDAFGGGDIKLMAASGLMLGWKLTLFAVLAAILTGGTYGIWLLATEKKEKKEHFAFGPFLGVGMVAAVFIGEPVLKWYFGLLVI